jgi:hypothetical protein
LPVWDHHHRPPAPQDSESVLAGIAAARMPSTNRISAKIAAPPSGYQHLAIESSAALGISHDLFQRMFHLPDIIRAKPTAPNS